MKIIEMISSFSLSSRTTCFRTLMQTMRSQSASLTLNGFRLKQSIGDIELFRLS